MGDRANVVVKDDFWGDVFLYTHWGGEKIPQVVHRALSRRERWEGAPYLTRIIFCEMMRERNAFDASTGFGISASPILPDHPHLVVDVARQEVYFEDQDQDEPKGIIGEPVSFEEYIAVAERTWPEEEEF